MDISLALDGSKRRDIRLYQDDSDILTVKVYQRDGDKDPIATENVTALAITTAGWFDGVIPVGTTFDVPKGLCGRNWYTLTGLVNGARTTLAYGWILGYGDCERPCPWGNGYGWRWPYGPGNCGVLP